MYIEHIHTYIYVCLFVLNIFEYRTFLIWPHFTNYTQVFVVISFQLNLDYISSFVLLQFSSGLFFLSACDIGLKTEKSTNYFKIYFHTYINDLMMKNNRRDETVHCGRNIHIF